jgi:hypothetical protein
LSDRDRAEAYEFEDGDQFALIRAEALVDVEFNLERTDAETLRPDERALIVTSTEDLVTGRKQLQIEVQGELTVPKIGDPSVEVTDVWELEE